MIIIKVVILTIFIITVSSAPKELIEFSLSSYILPDKKLEMELNVITPRSSGEYPVILFMTGLAGLLPAVFQR